GEPGRLEHERRASMRGHVERPGAIALLNGVDARALRWTQEEAVGGRHLRVRKQKRLFDAVRLQLVAEIDTGEDLRIAESARAGLGTRLSGVLQPQPEAPAAPAL